MTKDKYLEKIAYAKSDIRVLVAATNAGITKVHLERIEEALQNLYNEVANTSEEIFKEFVSHDNS